MASRDNYSVIGNDIEELKRSLNFLLQRLADRMDKIEGIRGTPTFSSSVDMSSNQINSLAAPTEDDDAARKTDAPGQGLESTDSPTFAGLTVNGTITLADAVNIALNTSTGTKIGTSTGQKVGFLNATPVARQSKISDPSGGATVDSQARTAINSIIDALEAFGFTAP